MADTFWATKAYVCKPNRDFNWLVLACFMHMSPRCRYEWSGQDCCGAACATAAEPAEQPAAMRPHFQCPDHQQCHPGDDRGQTRKEEQKQASKAARMLLMQQQSLHSLMADCDAALLAMTSVPAAFSGLASKTSVHVAPVSASQEAACQFVGCMPHNGKQLSFQS